MCLQYGVEPKISALSSLAIDSLKLPLQSSLTKPYLCKMLETLTYTTLSDLQVFLLLLIMSICSNASSVQDTGASKDVVLQRGITCLTVVI